ncbi:hypothetical protein GGF38_005213, partial [Coemansia sp. RSA 25]
RVGAAVPGVARPAQQPRRRRSPPPPVLGVGEDQGAGRGAADVAGALGAAAGAGRV